MQCRKPRAVSDCVYVWRACKNLRCTRSPWGVSQGMRAFAVMAKILILHMFVSRGEGGREVEEKRPVFVSKKISVITDDPLHCLASSVGIRASAFIKFLCKIIWLQEIDFLSLSLDMF